MSAPFSQAMAVCTEALVLIPTIVSPHSAIAIKVSASMPCTRLRVRPWSTSTISSPAKKKSWSGDMK